MDRQETPRPFLFAMYAERRIWVSIGSREKSRQPRQALTHFTDTSSKTITTESKPNAFPSALRSKRSAVQTLTAEDVQTDAVIRQTCTECGRLEMRYYTLQLRSADEGSTVFYSCECGHKYVLWPLYIIPIVSNSCRNGQVQYKQLIWAIQSTISNAIGRLSCGLKPRSNADCG